MLARGSEANKMRRSSRTPLVRSWRRRGEGGGNARYRRLPLSERDRLECGGEGMGRGRGRGRVWRGLARNDAVINLSQTERHRKLTRGGNGGGQRSDNRRANRHRFLINDDVSSRAFWQTRSTSVLISPFSPSSPSVSLSLPLQLLH